MLRDFTKECFDVLILAGQSNAEGYGFGKVEEPYAPSEGVWYLNPDLSVSLAAEKVTGNGIQSNFGLSFAREYIKSGRLKEGRKLLILRAAVGGTGFLDHKWRPEDPLFLHMLTMLDTALDLNPQNRVVALLWHQGETDVSRHATREVHRANLSRLVELTRAHAKLPQLPFLAGDFVPEWKAKQGEGAFWVTDAIRDVCKSCAPAAFVETDGLLSNFEEQVEHPLGWPCDDIHFSRRSIYALGVRYFEAFASLSGEK